MFAQLPEAARAANAQGTQGRLRTSQSVGPQTRRAGQPPQNQRPWFVARPRAPVPPHQPPVFATNSGGDVGYHAQSTSSGTKTNTPLSNIPQSITVVTKQQVQDIGAQRLEDVAHYVPGVNWHQGEGNRDQIIIRGVSSTADFFVDGHSRRWPGVIATSTTPSVWNSSKARTR